MNRHDEITRMSILAIDPGPRKSAYVKLAWGRCSLYVIESRDAMPNEELLALISRYVNKCPPVFVIEIMTYYGKDQTVGSDITRACIWIGRFEQAYYVLSGEQSFHELTKPQINRQICGHSYAKKPEVHAALIDRFEPTGGGAKPRKGTKKQPGPLFGVKGHAWDALAVAVAWAEIHAMEATKDGR